ncbi:MAG: hypothetical protein RJA07_1131 [Bacteroidota bacterium]|jgi:hypothetical protein
MKLNKTIVVLIALAMVCGIWGCKKYPDGPTFTLLSKTQRLIRLAEINYYSVGGQDITDKLRYPNVNFTKEGKFTTSYFITESNGKEYYYETTSGEWSFVDNKNKLNIVEVQDKYETTASGNRANFIEKVTKNTTYTILRLKTSGTWLTTTDSNGIETVIHYRSK